MADDNDILTDLNLDPGANDPNTGPNPGNGADDQPMAGLIAQYIKDLSVENPNAPTCYQWTDQPSVDVQFNIGATPVSDEVSEVELKITVGAKMPQGNLYLVELSYAGLVGLRNVPEDAGHAFLYAEAPRLLFPFARRVVADATRDAGFAPLMLDPMDFTALYQQQLAQRQAEGVTPWEKPASGELN